MRLLKQIFFKFIYFGLLFFLESCLIHRLDVQTQYLSHENLASYYVGTPDPLLENPPIGQRLLIQWSLTSKQMKSKPIYLHLSLLFRNHQQKKVVIPIEDKRAYYLYEIIDKEYIETGGILSYLVEIHDPSCIIASWKHPLWAELITFENK